MVDLSVEERRHRRQLERVSMHLGSFAAYAALFLQCTCDMKWFVAPTLMLAALPFLEAAPASGAPGDANPCIEPGAGSVWGGLGWNHVIYLTNKYCSDAVVCAVSTDVDSCVQTIIVPATQTVAVVTALNSEAQAFIPNISCDYAPKPP